MVTMTVSSLLMGPLVLVPMMLNTMVEGSIEEKRVINNQREDTKEEPGDLSYIQTFCFQQVTYIQFADFQTSPILSDSFPRLRKNPLNQRSDFPQLNSSSFPSFRIFPQPSSSSSPFRIFPNVP